jgi:hypothetical protein
VRRPAMSTPYDEMWEKLNLDLQAHEGLLSVLGKFYGDIYLSQDKRLKGMEYLDFVLSEVHGLRIKELQEAKAQGRKIVGTFCVFVPEEIVLAADAVCVGLCAGAEIGKESAEKILPRNTCALIKSFVGFKLPGAKRPLISPWACTWPSFSAPWPCSAGSVTRRLFSLLAVWPTTPVCGPCWRKISTNR